MACYHDRQDFKSDFNIEVARECDILQEGVDLDKIRCDKNPGHLGFIPFKDLKIEDLPQEVRNTETLETIKKWGNSVARLRIVMEDGRKWSGSGYAAYDGNKFMLLTNNHVVKTDDEVKHCTVEFFYDSHDKSNVLTSKGKELLYTSTLRDITYFLFDPVPDFLLSYQLDIMQPPPYPVVMYRNNRIVICDSFIHHLNSQAVSYTFDNLNNPHIDMMFMSLNDNSISYLTSSYFKFKPIPSNIQELTRIAIHINEDGNSRVIPGDVVKFNDDYVVKISESIFQDNVKKCSLVLNGKVISRGTRLYFQQVKSLEFLSDLHMMGDDESFIQVLLTNPNSWLFDVHPQLRTKELMNEVKHAYTDWCTMCCIGHPHGSIKMVTFGRLLGKKLERFDNKDRNIPQYGKDCKCRKVMCIKYSCKTCVGSSGSPVFVPQKVFEYTSGRNHFMGQKLVWLQNGELTDNVNTAW